MARSPRPAGGAGDPGGADAECRHEAGDPRGTCRMPWTVQNIRSASFLGL